MENILLNNLYNLYKINETLPKGIVDMICNPQNYNLKEKRILTINEILDANSDMQIDFVSLQIIPFIDCFDNDYICYDYQNKEWLMFNIVDEIKFRQSDNLDELLN